jgi:hypothetical protein
VLKEIVLSDYLGFKFPSNDFMFEPVNRIITQLHESGIAKKIVDDEAAVKYQEKQAEPMPLSLHHFENWFALWGFILVFSVAAFSCEFLLKLGAS